MDKYAEGDVLFDQLLVTGQGFFKGRYTLGTNSPLVSYHDHAFAVKAVIAKRKRKKGEPEHYNYVWSGHINICSDNHRVHLHEIEGDVGLVKQEAKMVLLKTKIEEFLKELTKRSKDGGTKPITVRTWLNPEDSRYTGYVAYYFGADGAASLTFADCHKSVISWVYSHVDDEGVPLKNNLDKGLVKHLEEICKGIQKAITAVQQLRKFFEREVFDVTEK